MKMEHLYEIYRVNKLDSDTLPPTHQTIDNINVKKKYGRKIKCANYHTKYFCGGGNTFMLIYRKDKISGPTIFLKYVVNWYHAYLLYLVT